MKVLITGGRGTIGSKLAAYCAELGHAVAITSRRAQASSLGASVVICSDLSAGSIERGINRSSFGVPDLVFHLASSLKFHQSRAALYSSNVALTKNVLDYCALAGVKTFVLASSIEAQGPGKTKGGAIDETRMPEPASNYGWSKLMAEKTVLERSSDGVRKLIARIGNVYDPDKCSMLSEIVKSLKDKRELWFFRSELREAAVCPVALNDLVRGLMLLAEKGRDGGIYYLVGSKEITLGAVLEGLDRANGLTTSYPPVSPAKYLLLKAYEKAFRTLGFGDTLSYIFSGGPEKLSRLYSGDKALKELGFAPATELDRVMDRLVTGRSQ